MALPNWDAAIKVPPNFAVIPNHWTNYDTHIITENYKGGFYVKGKRQTTSSS